MITYQLILFLLFASFVAVFSCASHPQIVQRLDRDGDEIQRYGYGMIIAIRPIGNGLLINPFGQRVVLWPQRKHTNNDRDK